MSRSKLGITGPEWGARLTALQERLGLSVYEFAALMNVAPGTIYNWKRRGRDVHTTCAEKVVSYLEQAPDIAPDVILWALALNAQDTRPWPERIEDLISERLLTHDEFVRLIGVSRNSLRNWQHRDREPDGCPELLMSLMAYQFEEAAPFIWRELILPDVMPPERIKTIRYDLGLDREAMAHLLGVSYDTLRSWEMGFYEPMMTCWALLEFLEDQGHEATSLLVEAIQHEDEEWPIDRIKNARLSVGATQQELGDLLRIQGATIAGYEIYGFAKGPRGCLLRLYWLLENYPIEIMHFLRK